MFRRIPEQLSRWYDQQETPTKIAAIAGVLLMLVGVQHETAKRHRITRAEEAQLREQAEEVLMATRMQARAEADRLKAHPRKRWVSDPVAPRTPVTRPAGNTGRATFRVRSSFGFFYVNDARHRASTADPNPVDLIHGRHSVAAGSRGQVLVSASADAQVLVALEDRAPAALPAGMREVSDMDLDLDTGRLVFTGDDGADRVVVLRSGSYRMRVAAAGAPEGNGKLERFRIELWPRSRDGELQVLRPSAG